AHGFLDPQPTVSRKGVGLGTGDKPSRRHLRPNLSLPPLPNPQPVPFLPSRCQENLGNWVGKSPEMAPAVPSASRAEGTPRCSAQGRALAPSPAQAVPRRETSSGWKSRRRGPARSQPWLFVCRFV
ncbi:hypothetical protein EI555_002049, partial [Monodon monoceros]